MSKRSRTENSESPPSSPSFSSSSSSYLLVTHSHSYAQRTYGDVTTTHYPSLSSLLKFIRSTFITAAAEILEVEDEDGEEIESKKKDLKAKFSDKAAEEDPRALVDAFVAVCKEIKETIEEQMIEKEDDFCDFRPFNLVRSLIIVSADGKCTIIDI